MKLADSDPADCLLILGLTRPKFALFLISVAFLSLFFTFNVLYDTAVCNYDAAGSFDDEITLIEGNRLNMLLLENRSTIVYGNRVHFPRTSRRLPQAIIIGVRKCGTRALLEMLFLHPHVQKANGEIHFFDRDENYYKGLDWYRKKMPHSFRGQITIEKSPSYFVTPEVPERIRAMNTSVKLLLIVREPVTRAISDYTQLRSHSATASSSMQTSIPVQQRSFEELALLPDGTVNMAYRPLAISLYHMYLLRWLEVFDKTQIHIVNGDQLIKDPVPELQKIETFLGLEHRISRNNFYFNNTKGFYCLRNETADKCLRETKGRKHPRVNPVAVTKLRQFFSEHNQKFYELIGEDLGWPEQ